MPKLRVYQLARELNRDNSEIIRELQHMGVPVTSHSNTVEDRLAEQLRKKRGVFVPSAGVAAAEPVEEIVEAAASETTIEAEAPPVEVVHPEIPAVEATPVPEPPPVVETKVEEKPAPVVEHAKV